MCYGSKSHVSVICTCIHSCSICVYLLGGGPGPVKSVCVCVCVAWVLGERESGVWGMGMDVGGLRSHNIDQVFLCICLIFLWWGVVLIVIECVLVCVFVVVGGGGGGGGTWIEGWREEGG